MRTALIGIAVGASVAASAGCGSNEGFEVTIDQPRPDQAVVEGREVHVTGSVSDPARLIVVPGGLSCEPAKGLGVHFEAGRFSLKYPAVGIGVRDQDRVCAFADDGSTAEAGYEYQVRAGAG